MNDDELRDGAYLVVKSEHCTSTRPIKSDFVELDAALSFLHEGMIKAMLKGAELRPKSVRMSTKEIKAWRAYKKIMGKDIPRYFEYSSMNDIAQSGCDYIRKKIIAKKKKERREEIVDMGNPILVLDIP